MRLRLGIVMVGAVGCGPTPVSHEVDAAAHPVEVDASTVVPVDAPTCGIVATFRDFQSSHPDFEHAIHDDRGLTSATLGLDHKPEYFQPAATMTVSGKTSFDQWYRDVPGVNQTFQ